MLLTESEDMLGFLLVEPSDFVVAEDARAALGPDAGAALVTAYDALAGLGEWASASIEAALRASLVEGLGLKPKLAFTPVRVAVTGRRVSPPLFESMEILGRELSLARVAALRDSLTLG